MRGNQTDQVDEQTRQMEDAWMDNQETDLLPDGSIHTLLHLTLIAPQGAYREMMAGLMIGFFAGMLGLLWFRESVYTQQQKIGTLTFPRFTDIGLVAGIAMNCVFGLLRAYY
jgi:hypothetical protein